MLQCFESGVEQKIISSMASDWKQPLVRENNFLGVSECNQLALSDRATDRGTGNTGQYCGYMLMLILPPITILLSINISHFN